MSIKGDVISIGVAVAAAVAVGYFVKGQLSKAIAALPPVIREGGEAIYVLTGAAFDVARDPLDGFGITPGTFADGTPKWQPTAPWNNTNTAAPAGMQTNDPVSNSDIGMNFNLF
jgi:hypothetical protein